MSIWITEFSLEGLQQMSSNTMVEHLEIKFTAFGDDFLKATMPVNAKTVQPMRLLHGGASVVLAETIGSTASSLCLPPDKFAVGLEINANHIRPVREGGMVEAFCKMVHLGNTTHIWQIDITNNEQKLVCTSRLTMAVRSID